MATSTAWRSMSRWSRIGWHRRAVRWPDRSSLLAAISHAVDAALSMSPTIGVATSVFVSRVAAGQATVGKPIIVAAETTRAYLSPFPIEILPLDEDLREYLEL